MTAAAAFFAASSATSFSAFMEFSDLICARATSRALRKLSLALNFCTVLFDSSESSHRMRRSLYIIVTMYEAYNAT